MNEELGVDRRERVGHGGQREGGADAGHDVLALGVDEEVAVGAGRAGGRVAGEGHAGARAVVAVAEHHRLHVDRGAEVVGDALAAAVGLGPGRLPRLRKTASTAPRSWACGSCGKGAPVWASMAALYCSTSALEGLGAGARRRWPRRGRPWPARAARRTPRRATSSTMRPYIDRKRR